MIRYAIAITTACLLAPLLRADSIDDAEAKRRGVPVAQVQAENALAKEKAKEAALGKQIAELQKKLAELQGGAGGGGAEAAGTSTAPATAVAGGGDESPLNFDGPRASSPMYDDFVNRYLAGDWEKLGADMEAKKKEIGALPAGNVADLTYISRTLAECRPLWWSDVKNGKVKQIRQLVWKHAVVVNVQNGSAVQFMGAATVNGAKVLNVGWPLEWMDARVPLDMVNDVGLNIPGDFGLVRADGVVAGIWNLLGGAEIQVLIGPTNIQAIPQDQRITLARFEGLRQNLTAAYYGTPTARRIVLAESCASFEAGWNNRFDWEGRRPLGAAVLVELAKHPDVYKNVHIETIVGLDQLEIHFVEVFTSKPVVLQLLNNKLTLAEDRGMRNLIKTMAETNTKWDMSRVTLPNNVAYDLDPAKDGPLAEERKKAIQGK